MISRPCRIAVCLLLALAASAAGQEQAEKLDPHDIDLYLKVEYARSLTAARKVFLQDAQQREKLDTAADDVVKAAGMTAVRYDAVQTLIKSIADAFAGLEKGGEEAEAATKVLHDSHKPSVDLVKERLKEINDITGRAERAQAQAENERRIERYGTPPDAAALAGTWRFDLRATIAARSIPQAKLEKTRDALIKTYGLGAYTFGPGDAIAVTVPQPENKTKTEKGAYRLEGNALFVRIEGAAAEKKLIVGMKGEYLVFTSDEGIVCLRKP